LSGRQKEGEREKEKRLFWLNLTKLSESVTKYLLRKASQSSVCREQVSLTERFSTNLHLKVALVFCSWSFSWATGSTYTKKPSTNPMLTINPKQTIISIWFYPA